VFRQIECCALSGQSSAIVWICYVSQYTRCYVKIEFQIKGIILYVFATLKINYVIDVAPDSPSSDTSAPKPRSISNI